MISLALVSAWLATDLVSTYGVFHYRRRLISLEPARATPRVLIVVAVKGITASTIRFFDALAAQNYPAFRLVIAVESSADPAVALAEQMQARVAGKSRSRSWSRDLRPGALRRCTTCSRRSPKSGTRTASS